MMKSSFIAILAAGVGPTVVQAFSVETRRSFLDASAATAAAVVGASTLVPTQPAWAEFRLGDPNSVVGREIRSFNALINEFKNTALDGGLDASKIQEPSMPFVEFGEFMKSGKIAEVEFLAPSGQVAYVTLKGKRDPPKSGKKPAGPTEMIGSYPAGVPIRIGQGYPTGGKNSWSSPDYVIRSVSNFGVPYKFTVPALKAYAKKK